MASTYSLILRACPEGSREAVAVLLGRLARFGGEEFLVLMPCTGNEDAVAAATRVREAVASVGWGTAAPGLAVTASAGVAVARIDETVEALLDRADKALYEAKNAGRNCIRSR